MQNRTRKTRWKKGKIYLIGLLGLGILGLLFSPSLQAQAAESCSIESNVFAHYNRYIRLSDGSCWKVKLNSGFFHTDKETGAFWRRGDFVCLRETQDPGAPYAICRGALCQESEGQHSSLPEEDKLLVIQVDPLIPGSVDINQVGYFPQNPKVTDPSDDTTPDKLVVTGNIFVSKDKRRFFSLSDGSYWELCLDHGWFSSDTTTAAFWRLGDTVELVFHEDPKYPYLIINHAANEKILCCQVDPSFPRSVGAWIPETTSTSSSSSITNETTQNNEEA